MTELNSIAVVTGKTEDASEWNNMRLDALKRIDLIFSENISAGDLINLINDGGVLKAELTYSGAVLDEANYFGIATTTATTGNVGRVTLIGGIDDNQTGMTIGAVQYISNTGTLTEVDAGNGSAGIAMSATEILINKDLT